MSENFKSKKIGVTALCRISAKGGEGVYLYIPKNFADVYGVAGADYAEVRFGNLFVKVSEPVETKKDNVEDLRSRKKNAPGEDNDLQKGDLS